MSELMIRNLAMACAPKIAAHVEAAVMATVREHLPGTIEAVLRDQYPGETVRLYVPKKPVTARRDRDNAIRAAYTGHNVAQLAAQFGLSKRMIFNIVKAR